ncbi:MAG: putative beta-lysine N-acetyltransferase [Euryarchaeota archaeon]|nr:putative beta-lysine N-acetyltransferase [Euryarchaeota archaeon]
MTNDTICRVGGSLIQHGDINQRIYLMHLDPKDLPCIIAELDRMAGEHGYSKIFVKIPVTHSRQFLEAGYTEEARVKGMFHGTEDGLFLTKYPDPKRREIADPDSDLIGDVLEKAQERAGEHCAVTLPTPLVCRECDPDDAEALADLYREVFATYPFPITDPEYLKSTMESHIRYWAIWDGDSPVAASSAEMAPAERNVEMTDFATLPACRGYRLSSCLLTQMEETMKREGFAVAYTICRAESYPINITFSRTGYRFGGTLRNNTQICGGFESMNIWYTRL